jgi:hypothetical protein
MRNKILAARSNRRIEGAFVIAAGVGFLIWSADDIMTTLTLLGRTIVVVVILGLACAGAFPHGLCRQIVRRTTAAVRRLDTARVQQARRRFGRIADRIDDAVSVLVPLPERLTTLSSERQQPHSATPPPAAAPSATVAEHTA